MMMHRKKSGGDDEKKPKLINRRLNQKSSLKIGRTISEKRERVESSLERTEARKKGKRKKFVRVLFVILGFSIVLGTMAFFMCVFVQGGTMEGNGLTEKIVLTPEPTIEIVDMATSGDKITSRMKEYIGRAEQDWRDLGYNPVKVIIPAGSIRQVNFYIEGLNGYIKMTIDRGTAVSVEDADRMIRYLGGMGITDFEYIDVRVEEKGYWK